MEMRTALKQCLQASCPKWGMTLIEYPELLVLTSEKPGCVGHIHFEIQFSEHEFTVTRLCWLGPAREVPKDMDSLFDKVKEEIQDCIRFSGEEWYYFEMPTGEDLVKYAAFSTKVLAKYPWMKPV